MTERQLRRIINTEIKSVLKEGGIRLELTENDALSDIHDKLISELFFTLKSSRDTILNLPENEYEQFSIDLENATDKFSDFLDNYFGMNTLPDVHTFTREVKRWFENTRGRYELRPTVQNAIDIIDWFN